MKKGLALLGVIAFLCLPTVSAEPRDSYIGVQLGTAEAEDEELGYGLLRLGVKASDRSFIEFRTGIGLDDTDVDGITVEIERITGIYGTYRFAQSNNYSLYGIGGWSEVTLKGSLGGLSAQQDENGFSYGFGLEIFGLNVEWMQYLDTKELEASAVAIGYNYRFQ